MIRQLIAITLICLFSISSGFAAEKPDPRTMSFPVLKFEIPKGERVLLNTGTPVYLLQDSELPIVTITAMLRGGSLYDPVEKQGLAALTSSQMRSGGTANLTPDELDQELEFMASGISAVSGSDLLTISMTSLTKNLDRTMHLFSDVIYKPRFDEHRFEHGKKQAQDGIRRQDDDPKAMAGRELQRAIYRNHPAGNFPTMESVAAITRADMQELHRRYIRSDNMILTVSGDFDKAEMLEKLNRLILPVRTRDRFVLPPLPELNHKLEAELIHLPKQVNQSVIRMGHLGISKDDPDIYAVRVLNYILGGSFTSRLMTEIRTNQGLAYNVGSSFEPGRLYRGSFIAETETKAESTVKAIGLMKSIIAGIRNEPVSQQELDLARDAIINSFIFAFTTADAIVQQQARLEFFNYPSDYLDSYRDKIAVVTQEDVMRVARKWLHPDALKLVVAGDEKQLDQPLATLK